MGKIVEIVFPLFPYGIRTEGATGSGAAAHIQKKKKKKGIKNHQKKWKGQRRVFGSGCDAVALDDLAVWKRRDQICGRHFQLQASTHISRRLTLSQMA